MAGKRVLVVDDDEKTVELVKLYLNRDGYRVITAYEGEEALQLAREAHPDLIVLDLMLPGINGLEICRTLRQESDIPIIMLTAMTTDEDRLRGLDLGADDYVTKPFSPRELAARVRAVLRRIPGERGPNKITYGDITLDFLKHEASAADRPLKLTPVCGNRLTLNTLGSSTTKVSGTSSGARNPIRYWSSGEKPSTVAVVTNRGAPSGSPGQDSRSRSQMRLPSSSDASELNTKLQCAPSRPSIGRASGLPGSRTLANARKR